MPETSRFFGIVIRMYFNDHGPAHFHAIYGDDEAVVGIDPIQLKFGRLPPRAFSLVVEWAGLHQRELLENCRPCVQGSRRPRYRRWSKKEEAQHVPAN